MVWNGIGWAVLAAFSFLFSALLALRGTNAQARTAKRRWLADPDVSVVAAARLWAPGPRWIRGRKHVAKFKALEAEIQKETDVWVRYQALLSEFRAWNDLETAVTLAVPASLISAVLAYIQAKSVT